MRQNIKVINYLHFCALFLVENADKATACKVWPDNKLREIY